MTNSLRKRLLASLLIATALIWGITAYISYSETRKQIAELFDAELSQSARVLMALVKNSLHEGELPRRWKETQLISELTGYLPGHRYERKLAFQLWTVSGQLVLRSSSAPLFPLSTENHGFSTAVLDEESWHIFSLPDHEGHFIAHVAQREDIRGDLIDDIATELLRQFQFGFPLLAVVTWILVSQSLKPIKNLVKQVDKQHIDNLITLQEKKIPNELLPLVEAFNDLLTRVKKTLENERRFTSDAAHELRTPLAGIKTQAQVAIKAEDEKISKHALLKMDEAVDRLSHTVHQLLTLARINPDTNQPDTVVSVDLAERTMHAIEDMEYLAHNKHIELSIDQADHCIIIANTTMLDILLRNLIDNAIRYTPVGGAVKVRIEQKKNIVQFLIDDSGPGIPSHLKDRVFQRFFRNVDADNPVNGSGLGLCIVSRIIKLHKADLKLEDSILGGLRVRISFSRDII